MMDTFSWLLIGHLLGEWLLQNDWMYFGKQKGLMSLSALSHCAVYASVIVLLLVGFNLFGGHAGCWLIIGLFLFSSHWVIEQTELVSGWLHFYGHRDSPLIRTMTDQILHLLVLALLSLYLAKW
jgi:hypothetical protein